MIGLMRPNESTSSETRAAEYGERRHRFAHISFIIFARWQHASRIWSKWCIWDPHFGEEVIMGQRWYHSKEWWWFLMVVSYRLYSVTLRYLQPFVRNLPLNISDAQIIRDGVGHRGVKFGEDSVSQIFTRSRRDMGLSCAKISLDIFCRLSTMHERDDRPRNGNN